MTQYSGIVVPGRNPQGSYDRLQHKTHCDSVSSIIGYIQSGIEDFSRDRNSRLDMRISCDIGLAEYASIFDMFPDDDLTYIADPRNPNRIIEITFCRNKDERNVGKVRQAAITARIRSKVQALPENRTQIMHDQLVLFQMEHMRASTGADSITAQEIYRIWGESFGWNLAQCRGLHDGLDEERGEGVYVLRSRTKELIGALLIQGGESTEWFVSPDFRGRHKLLPLLVIAHAHWVQKNPESPLYGHLRWDRSLGLGLNSGMDVPLQSRPLFNHVAIGGEPPELENLGRPILGTVSGEHLRTFIGAQLNPAYFTPEILCISAACIS